MRKLSAAAFLLFALFFNAYAEEKPSPSPEPIFRIETGMHTSEISRIGIDSNNRYLITASYDKTVRVWDFPSGALLSTIRLPIGWGDEGKIYSVAISPDGKTVACAGWTGYEWEHSNSVYFFNRKSGKLLKRIKGLPSVVLHLVYSKDGKFLVASVGRGNGFRVFRTGDYTQVAEDSEYRFDTYGADFDQNGRLVTASYDGMVRLYDKNFKQAAKIRAVHGNRAYSVRFSPDGLLIANGFDDSQTIDVFSGKDLSYLYSPDSTGVDNGDLSKVSWSADGRFLYAGGRFNIDGINQIRKWDGKGEGKYNDLPAARDTIMHILPLKDGGIVFGAADPAFGAFDAEDKKFLNVDSSIADFRANHDGFLISHDGSLVEFGYEFGGGSPARFSIINCTLTPLSEKSRGQESGLLAPRPAAEGLNITGWNSLAPRLNGRPLVLKQYELSRSAAVASDGESFLLGTDWYIRFFDKDGNEIWNISTPAPAWTVNISGNGKIAVAALGDGTIRWYTMAGEELLALFLPKDRSIWIAWTPSGYYNASPEADKIIGWHKNNGIEKSPDFIQPLKFDTYYRPDVLKRVFYTLDEAEALRLANAELDAQKLKDSKWRVLKRGKRIVYYYKK